MTDCLTIALAQHNPTVGDIAGNVRLARECRTLAGDADLVVLSELFVCGYPPEDLVLKPAHQRAVEAAVNDLAADTADGGPAILLGAPWLIDGALYNTAILLADGAVAAVRAKHDLPNYGVFDEKRVFQAGPLPGPMNFKGVRLGAMVCEDMWTPDVTECLQETGAEILVVPNGSPFELDKTDERLGLAVSRVVESGLPLIYLNQLGGQDELVFDGSSFVLNADRDLAVQMPAWEPGVVRTTWRRTDDGWRCDTGERAAPPDRLANIYAAMVTGLRDYVTKNRFPGVLLGMSGGIDSALSAAVAVDALGADKVIGVLMPSRFTSDESNVDAAECCANLGMATRTIGIEPAVTAFDGMLAEAFAEYQRDTTEENIQARIRGIILMALSNKYGHMLLTTGNKSEMSVGYATLYGDMAGGYSVLKDVYKTTVYALSEWRNANRLTWTQGPDDVVIPPNIISKAPSAELAPDQRDQDSLPPYNVLDDILHGLIEEEMPVGDIVARGHDRALVNRVEHMLYIAEYKRRQAPPGVKITRKNFGRDRRYPITNGFRDVDADSKPGS
jgi:NAD+ synthase